MCNDKIMLSLFLVDPGTPSSYRVFLHSDVSVIDADPPQNDTITAGCTPALCAAVAEWC